MKTDITLKSVYQARQRIAPVIRKTPLVRSTILSEKQGGEVCLKLENLQETGSFKLRGAANALLALTPEQKTQGVLAFSTGNHGRAVAWVARELGVSCTICLSQRVPSYRVEAMKSFGAEVVQEGASQDEAYDTALALEKDRGLTMVKPFDDPLVIAGQGTMGLEILEQQPGIDTLVVPVSGGGLAAGLARVIKAADPAITVIGVSMEVAPAMYHSIRAGKPVEVAEKDSLADALLGGIGLDNAYTYPMVVKYLDRIDLVSETEIEAGMAFAYDHQGILIEGAAAVTLSWLLKHQSPGKTTVGILSGGNVDTQTLLDILKRRQIPTN
jgi:threonine dehydratase